MFGRLANCLARQLRLQDYEKSDFTVTVRDHKPCLCALRARLPYPPVGSRPANCLLRCCVLLRILRNCDSVFCSRELELQVSVDCRTTVEEFMAASSHGDNGSDDAELLSACLSDAEAL